MKLNRILGIASAMSCFPLTPAIALAGVKGDTNKDGQLDGDEFVIFLGERDVKFRDKDGDGRLSLAEWTGEAKSGFRHVAIEKFNANKDNFMDAPEIVEVYLWTFDNRDKNKDGVLTGKEIPNHLRK